MTGLFGAAPEPMSLWAMLGGGLLAFVSPCVLPMLPVYAMYLLGGTDAAPGRLRVLRRCLGLLCGFVLLFTLMGAGAGALGSLLKNTDRGTLDVSQQDSSGGIRPTFNSAAAPTPTPAPTEPPAESGDAGEGDATAAPTAAPTE